jgi:hypothetical protein
MSGAHHTRRMIMGRVGFSYIGKCKKCGNYVAVVADEAGFEKETAKIVAEFIKDGLIIERVTHDFVRENFSPCKCSANKPIQEEMEL